MKNTTTIIIGTVLVGFAALLCVASFSLTQLAPELAAKVTTDFPLADTLGEPLELLLSKISRQVRSVISFENITLTGNYRLGETEIFQSAGIYSGAWIWQLPAAKVAERIGQLNWVDQADVVVGILPSTLKISVVEAEPWLIVHYQGQSWVVSSSGRMLSPLSRIENADLVFELSELPRLEGLDAQPGLESYLASPNARFSYALSQLRFLEMAQTIPFDVEIYRLLPEGELELRFRNPQGRLTSILLTVRSFEQAEDLALKLKAVLSDLTARSEVAREIDLRFLDQVIVSQERVS